MKQIVFTHLYVAGFGWENTIFNPSDFKEVDLLGENSEDGEIYIGNQENGVHRIFKGYALYIYADFGNGIQSIP